MQTPLRHFTSSRFWDCYWGLPEAVQRLADANYALLKRDPHHPSLHLKQIGQLWSVRVGRRYRALGVSAPDGIVWFWIGNHNEYDRLISSLSK